MPPHMLIGRRIHPDLPQLTAQLLRPPNQLIGESIQIWRLPLVQNLGDEGILLKDGVFDSAEVGSTLAGNRYSLSSAHVEGDELLQLVGGGLGRFFGRGGLALFCYHIL